MDMPNLMKCKMEKKQKYENLQSYRTKGLRMLKYDITLPYLFFNI